MGFNSVFKGLIVLSVQFSAVRRCADNLIDLDRGVTAELRETLDSRTSGLQLERLPGAAVEVHILGFTLVLPRQ